MEREGMRTGARVRGGGRRFRLPVSLVCLFFASFKIVYIYVDRIIGLGDWLAYYIMCLSDRLVDQSHRPKWLIG